MIDLSLKSDQEISQQIQNYEKKSATDLPFYQQLLEERLRRDQLKSLLSIEKSLVALKVAAIERRCVTYGDLAKASNVSWNKARLKMSGSNGHLDLLLDACKTRGLPMLPAICVNESGRQTGELEPSALAGFIGGARRLGFAVASDLAFHHQQREACWTWGAEQGAAPVV